MRKYLNILIKCVFGKFRNILKDLEKFVAIFPKKSMENFVKILEKFLRSIENFLKKYL